MRSPLFINNNYNLKKKTCCYQYACAIAPPETIFILKFMITLKNQELVKLLTYGNGKTTPEITRLW